MSSFTQLWDRRPPLATLIASFFVVGGLLLFEVSWVFPVLAAVAMFLPGILREMGWLKDKDEFQLLASRRAGYHAYLAGGLFAFLQVVWFRLAEPAVKFPGALLENVLIVMWFTWLLSSLIAFWGPHRCARRILLVFGSFWLVFNILAGEGNWMTSFMQSLLAMPFFLLAWGARYRPRICGAILLVGSVFFFHFFGLEEVFSGDPTLMGRVPVIVLFIGPLLASGLALMATRHSTVA